MISMASFEPIEELLRAIGTVQQCIKNKTLDDIRNDAEFKDNVLTHLEYVGECAFAIDETTQVNFPDINFEDAAFLKDIVMHDFFGIDYESLWGIITGGLIVLNDELSARLHVLRPKT